MGCCDNIIKSVLFVLNFLCTICGAVILGLSIWLLVNYKTFDRITENTIASPPIIMLIIGAAILIVAVLGCIGVCCDNSCMLITYASLLLVLFVAQVAVGIYIVVNGKDLGGPFRDLVQKEFDNTNSDQASFDFFQNMQKTLECCGVDGPEDYRGKPGTLFNSCCKSATVCIKPDFHQGCASKITEFVENNSEIFGGVAIGVAVIEILGAIAGFAAAKYVKQGY